MPPPTHGRMRPPPPPHTLLHTHARTRLHHCVQAGEAVSHVLGARPPGQALDALLAKPGGPPIVEQHHVVAWRGGGWGVGRGGGDPR